MRRSFPKCGYIAAIGIATIEQPRKALRYPVWIPIIMTVFPQGGASSSMVNDPSFASSFPLPHREQGHGGSFRKGGFQKGRFTGIETSFTRLFDRLKRGID
jgi:hypothetical protein